MPAILPDIDPAVLGQLKSGDESALERLFAEWYVPLVEVAGPLLDGDGASAARGVENLFAQLWKQRDDVATPEALEAFLSDGIHEAVARIKSRHAIAHQLAEHEGGHARKAAPRGAPSADEAWTTLYASLHVSAAHAAEVAHEAAEHSRHETAGHVAAIAAPRSWKPMIAMGFGVLAVAIGLTWWANRGREMAEIRTGVAAPDARAVTTSVAEFNNVSLGDGSTVKLGPDSRLRIPRTFGDETRGVALDGTASFVVAPVQKGRFVVLAGNAVIAATGTQFTIRAYPDEGDITIRVAEGHVVATVRDSVRQLAAGAALVISRDGSMHDATPGEVEQSLGWTNGMVVATDRPLREVVVLAKQWFGLQLFVADTALLNRKVTLRAKLGGGEDAIKSIETSGGLERVWEGPNMVLKDRAAKGKGGGNRVP